MADLVESTSRTFRWHFKDKTKRWMLRVFLLPSLLLILLVPHRINAIYRRVSAVWEFKKRQHEMKLASNLVARRKPSAISSLNKNCLGIISLYLEIPSLVRFSAVNTHVHKVIESDILWRQHCKLLGLEVQAPCDYKHACVKTYLQQHPELRCRILKPLERDFQLSYQMILHEEIFRGMMEIFHLINVPVKMLSLLMVNLPGFRALTKPKTGIVWFGLENWSFSRTLISDAWNPKSVQKWLGIILIRGLQTVHGPYTGILSLFFRWTRNCIIRCIPQGLSPRIRGSCEYSVDITHALLLSYLNFQVGIAVYAFLGHNNNGILIYLATEILLNFHISVWLSSFAKYVTYDISTENAGIIISYISVGVLLYVTGTVLQCLTFFAWCSSLRRLCWRDTKKI